MHLEARNYLNYCANNFNGFYHGKVLDVGSGDVNGNNKMYLKIVVYWV